MKHYRLVGWCFSDLTCGAVAALSLFPYLPSMPSLTTWPLFCRLLDDQPYHELLRREQQSVALAVTLMGISLCGIGLIHEELVETTAEGSVDKETLATD